MFAACWQIKIRPTGFIFLGRREEINVCRFSSFRVPVFRKIIFRVNIRGTNRPGVFQLFLSGEDVDFKSLRENRDVQTVQNTMNTIIGRDDINVTEITWQGEWRSVLLFKLSRTVVLSFFRPNIRIADHFRVGRIFLAGGQNLSV